MLASRVDTYINCVEEHKRSTIGNHVKDEHGQDPETIKSNFKILKNCQNKLDCLIFEKLFIRDLKPKLNKQCDSISARSYLFNYFTFKYTVPFKHLLSFLALLSIYHSRYYFLYCLDVNILELFKSVSH